MKFKRILRIFIISLAVMTLPITAIRVLANPKAGDIIIRHINDIKQGIFSDKDGIWQPNREKTNSFLIINNSDNPIKVKGFTFSNEGMKKYDENRKLSTLDKEHEEMVKNSMITISENDKKIYSGTLKDTFNSKEIPLANNFVVDNGDSKKLNMTFSIDPKADNDAQGINHEFSMGVNYELYDGDKDESEKNTIINENKNNLHSKLTNKNYKNDVKKMVGSIISRIPKTGCCITLGMIGALVLLVGTLIYTKPFIKEDKTNE